MIPPYYPHILIGGRQERAPDCFVLTPSASEKHAAMRRTLYRQAGEDDTALWARVLRAWHELCAPHGPNHHGTIECRYDKSTPPEGMQFDEDGRWNLNRALWHLFEDKGTPAVDRVECLVRLMQLDGMLPADFDSFKRTADGPRLCKTSKRVRELAAHLKVVQ